MAQSPTLDETQITEIGEELLTLPQPDTDPKDWPLGSQTTYLYSRTAERPVFSRSILQPMEPFRSSTIKYRIDVAELPNERCLVLAQPHGGEMQVLEEGKNEISFPSKDGPLYLYVQAGGPVGSAVVVTQGEQRQC